MVAITAFDRRVDVCAMCHCGMMGVIWLMRNWREIVLSVVGKDGLGTPTP